VRRRIKEKTHRVRLPPVGRTVPVLVNKKRTKAAFNLKDRRINAIAARKAEKAADEARFDDELRG
jgi:hypothetical protein